MEKQRPLVLVTNDDGIASPGLKAAVRGVLKYADVIVAAPCRQQTGMGRAFPRTEDLGIIEEVPYEVDHFQVPAYAILPRMQQPMEFWNCRRENRIYVSVVLTMEKIWE